MRYFLILISNQFLTRRTARRSEEGSGTQKKSSRCRILNITKRNYVKSKAVAVLGGAIIINILDVLLPVVTHGESFSRLRLLL